MITSPLLHDGSVSQRWPTKLILFGFLLLSVAVIHHSTHASSLEREVAETPVGVQWYFWDNYVSKSDWAKMECANGKKGKCKGDHVCGRALDPLGDMVADGMELTKHLYQAMDDGKEMDALRRVWQKPNAEQDYTLDNLLKSADQDVLDMFQAIGNGQAIIAIEIEPDHVFLLEASSGRYRMYQSWVDSFNLIYWVDNSKYWGVKKACWKLFEGLDEETAKANAAALDAVKDKFGKMKEFDKDKAYEIIHAALSQLNAKYDIPHKKFDFTGVLDMAPYVGLETTMTDPKGNLENVLRSDMMSRGVQVRVIYYIRPKK